jgi:hypothetical protein
MVSAFPGGGFSPNAGFNPGMLPPPQQQQQQFPGMSQSPMDFGAMGGGVSGMGMPSPSVSPAPSYGPQPGLAPASLLPFQPGGGFPPSGMPTPPGSPVPFSPQGNPYAPPQNQYGVSFLA